MTKRKFSIKKRFLALIEASKMIVRVSPLFFIIEIINSVLSSIMPLATTFFAAATTTALAEAYNGVQFAGDRAIFFMLTTAALGIAYLAWIKFQGYISDISRYSINLKIEDQLYEHFLNLEFWRYDDKNTIDLFDKARRFSFSFLSIFNSFIGIITQIFTLVASFIALYFVGWWLCIILVIAIVPNLLIQIKISRTQIKHWKENVGTRRSGYMVDKTLGDANYIAEIKLYGVVRHLLNLREELRNKDEKYRIEFERRYLWIKFAADVLESVVELVSLIYTTIQIINRSQPVGQFLYVQQIVSRAMGSARSFVMKINSIDEDVSNLFDYLDFLDLPTSEKRNVQLNSHPGSISLKNVTFHYPNHDIEVLKNVSIDILKNQHIAIVGENGAGKTTLTKLILGLYVPTKGKIFLDNNDLKDVDLKTWHDKISILQQDFVKYEFATARENIYFGNVNIKPNELKLQDAIDRSESRKFLENLPKGLDTYVDKWMGDDEENNSIELSGGQWQRLALARSFYRDSPVIILDEPTSAIDALAESRIFNNLFAKKDKTIITISHRLTTVEKADKIFMIEDGCIVESGTHDELVDLKGKYYKMFESQMHIDKK